MKIKFLITPYLIKNEAFKGIFRIMKICFILLFVFSFQLLAVDTKAQDAVIELKKNSMTVGQLINEIEKQTDYLVVYSNREIDANRKVTLQNKSNKVSVYLDEAFAGTDIGYDFENNYIVLMKKANRNASTIAEMIRSAQQQGKTITGKVVDVNGEPIIGATVLIKGTSHGTVTDMDGNYTLTNVPEDAVLQFSYVGMEPQEIPVSGKTVINVTMKEATELLEEVVVVGYGVQKKANLTGAVASVSSDVLENRPITNVGAGLQGAIANLNISLPNGKPGQGATFNVRGTTNFAGAGPLVLVDGVEMDPNLLNPSDIKDVVVLKDAASAAIYGARAAYGVVLISTKSGFATRKPLLSFSMNYAVNSPTVTPQYMNSLEYTQWMNDANTTTNGQNYFDSITMQHVYDYFNDSKNNLPVFHHPDDAPNTYRYCGNTDWYKTLNKDTYPIQQYNLNIQGGSENLNYYTSGGYFKQGGISKWANEDFERFNVLHNTTYKIANWIQVGLKTTISLTDKLSGGYNKWGSSSVDNILAGDSRPIMPLYHPDGHFAGYSGNGYFTNLAAWQSQGGWSTEKKNDFWATATLKITPFEGFTINGDYSYNYFHYAFKNYIREYWDYDAAGPAVIFPHTSPNAVSYSRSENFHNIFNLYGEYQKTLKGKHNLKGMVGFNQESFRNRGIGLSRDKLISNDIPFLSLATGERTTSDNEQEWAIRGIFYRFNYNYEEKYLLETNGRYDGSSRFPKEDRFKLFPSISAGWRISKESFWIPLSNIVNDFKIRASYGNLGNQVVSGYYPYIPTYGTGEVNYLFNGKKEMGVYAPGLVSDKLTWETVTQYDIGIDLSFLNNRLTATLDWYQRATKDMLTKSKTLPAILGTSEPQMNAADLLVKGWEGSFGWRNNLKNGFNYSVSLVISDYQGKVTKYDNPTKSLGDNYYEGKKLGEIWGFVTEGLFQTDAEASSWDQSKVIGYKLLPGDIKFADLDKDGEITYGASTVDEPGDRKIIGNSTPRYNFGFRGTAEWKGFDFTMFFQGVLKRDVIPNNTFYLSHYTSEWSVPQKMNYDYWREDNLDAFFPRARLNGSAVTLTQTRFLQNGAYIRLKNLGIGYTIPTRITQKAHISKLRLYFNGDNIWTYSKMKKGFDPEIANVIAYPLICSYSFGINVSF